MRQDEPRLRAVLAWTTTHVRRALEALYLGENLMSGEDRRLLHRSFADRVHF